MDNVAIRALPEKSQIGLEDKIIVEDNEGTKISQVRFLKSILQGSAYYNTIEDLKNATLNEGDVVEVLGYNKANDGGAAMYSIEYDPGAIEDGILCHYLRTSSTLRAKLIHGNVINVMNCGAYGDGLTDDRYEIVRALALPYETHFPTRVFKIGSTIEIDTNNTIVDFNNATLKCQSVVCLVIGRTAKVSNIIIKNAIFQSRYGVEIGPGAENVIIENCKFIPNKNSTMSRAIQINGARNITISNCVIGEADQECTGGIILNSGSLNGVNYGNEDIKIHNVSMTVSSCGVLMNSTTKDRAIAIDGLKVRGYYNADTTVTGVQFTNVCEYASLTNTVLTNLSKGVAITSTANITVGITDLVADAVNIMYSFLSSNATIYLSGTQKLVAGGVNADRAVVAKGNNYIFERMNGKLYLNTTITTSVLSSQDKVIQALTSLSGTVIDNTPFISRPVIEITSADQVNGNMDNKIPGYMNCAVNVTYAGTITDFPHPTLSGQIVAVYGTDATTLSNNYNMDLGADTKLNKYIPVVLKSNGGIWTKIY